MAEHLRQARGREKQHSAGCVAEPILVSEGGVTLRRLQTNRNSVSLTDSKIDPRMPRNVSYSGNHPAICWSSHDCLMAERANLRDGVVLHQRVQVDHHVACGNESLQWRGVDQLGRR